MAAKSKLAAEGMPEMDKQWQAESDLRTLTEAEKVKRDPDRLKAAMKKRDEMAKDLKAIKVDAND